MTRPGEPLNCPSCGAGLDTHNPGIRMLVCPFCANAVYWDEEAIRSAGQQSVLPEGFTRLFRGALGRLLKKRFVVVGRVRYSFGQGSGFWDEWFLEFEDGTTGWVGESDHELTLESQLADARVGPFGDYLPGTEFELQGTRYVVQETGEAVCLGAEGTLPKVVKTGERYPFVDASSPDGRYTLNIEYDDDPPTVFRGHWLRWNTLHLDDEGEDW